MSVTGFKRLNPKTGKPFVRGDKDDKGMRFTYYKTSFIRKDGSFSENWVSNEKFRIWIKNRKNQNLNFYKKNLDLNLKKRLNVESGIEFKMGDKRKDGYIFIGYSKKGRTKDGFRGEKWLSEKAYHKYRIALSLDKIKKRAKSKKIPINIGSSFLAEIFPKDAKCPILGIKMVFGKEDNNNSPSVDRLIPEKGYVRDNIYWVSKIANTIKSDRKPEELRMIADWIESQPLWEKHLL